MPFDGADKLPSWSHTYADFLACCAANATSIDSDRARQLGTELRQRGLSASALAEAHLAAVARLLDANDPPIGATSAGDVVRRTAPLLAALLAGHAGAPGEPSGNASSAPAAAFAASCHPGCTSTRALRMLLSNLPGSAYRCRNDAHWTMEYISEGCLALTGYSAADLIGNARVAYSELIHPTDREWIWDTVQAALRTRQPFRLEYRLRTAAGTEKWVWEQGQGVFAADGELQALEGFITDISQAKQTEATLREFERRFLEVLEHAQDVIYRLRLADGAFDYVSHATGSVLGDTPEQIRRAGRAGLLARVHPDDRDRYPPGPNAGEQPAAPVQQFELRLRHRDGSYRWVRAIRTFVCDASGGAVAAIGAFQDITARRTAELALRESEERYRTLAECSEDLIFIVGRDDRVCYVNRFGAARLKLQPQDMIGRARTDFIPGELGARQGRDLAQVLASGAARTVEDQIDEPAGPIWLHTRLVPLRGADGAVDAVLGVGRDITALKRTEAELCRYRDQLAHLVEQRTAELAAVNARLQAELAEHRQTEAALRESEERFQQIARNIQEIFWVAEPKNRRILYTSPAYERIYGRSCAELLARPEVWLDSIHPDDHPRILADLDAQQQGHPTEHEFRALRPDGTQRWVRSAAFPIRDARGEVYRVVGIAEDITERRESAAALLHANEEWERTFDAVPDLISIIDGQCRIVRANRALLERLGCTAQECLGQTCYTCVHGTAAPPRECPHVALLRDGASHVAELHEARLGADFVVSVSPIRDAAGRLNGSVHIARDVTAQKQAERALRESERLFRTLAETIPAAIIIGQDELVRYANPACTHLLGRTPAAVIGQPAWDFVHPDMQRLVRDRLAARQRGERVPARYEMRIVHPDRSERYVDFSAALITYEGRPAVLGAAIDITERKRAEDLLRAQRDLNVALSSVDDLRGAFDRTLDAACRISGLECGGIYVAEPATGALELFAHRGHSPEFIAAVSRFAPDTPQARFVRASAPLYRRGPDIAFMDTLMEREGLQSLCLIPVHYQGEPVGSLNLASRTCLEPPPSARDALEAIASRIGGVLGRVRASEALRRSEARNRAIVAAIPDLVFRLHRDGTYLDVHAPDDQLLALPVGALLGRRLTDLPLPAELVARSMAAVAATLAGGSLHTLEYRQQVPRGLRDFECRLVPCGPDEVLGVVRDMTDQRRAEERARAHQQQLAQVARVCTLGEMVSGLAHELAQPLTAVLYYARGCAARVEAGEWGAAEMGAALQKIALQAERAGEFIRSLKRFVRKARPLRARSDLNTVVREALTFAAPDLHARQIAVRCDLAPDLPAVVMDVIQIEQVILNLVRNALDALDAVPPDQRELRIATRVSPEGVTLTVCDNGGGVPPADVERVFEPFFTTKPAGTGLGLSISRSLIEAHEGRLWVEAARGRGALFAFTLPAARGDDDGEH